MKVIQKNAVLSFDQVFITDFDLETRNGGWCHMDRKTQAAIKNVRMSNPFSL